MIKSICIVRLSALGDVLMLVPLVRRLQDALPNAQITWIISRPAYDLVQGLEGIEFMVIEKPKSLGDYWQFGQKMKHRRFDVLLAAQASFRANLLYPFIKARRKLGYDKKRAKDGHGLFIKERISPGQEHTLEGFLKFADALSVSKQKLRWDIPVDEADKRWAKTHLPEGKGPVFIINPAASKPERNWLVERYVEVIEYALSKFQARVILTGGPGADERLLADEIKKAVFVTDLVGKTKPKQLLAVIACADLVLCPDTGPSHMAAAMGTPVVALHAVTNPQISGPYSCRDLVVDYYPQAMSQFIKKKDKHWGLQVHHPEAMRLIPVDDVLQQLTKIMGI